ncbi:hypothetical protein DXB03_17900, partial [Lachnospiraceae bacterium OF11-28]
RKSIIKRYQSKRTVGHTGIARECFAQRGNRTRSPHFKRELSGGSMSLTMNKGVSVRINRINLNREKSEK